MTGVASKRGACWASDIVTIDWHMRKERQISLLTNGKIVAAQFFSPLSAASLFTHCSRWEGGKISIAPRRLRFKHCFHSRTFLHHHASARLHIRAA